MTDNQHAIDNAKVWFESIRGMVAAADHSEWHKCSLCENPDKCRDQAMCDLGEAGEDEEDANQHILESPLSVLVRSGWYEPTGDPNPRVAPAEYEILLTTGGPALRIIGDLDQYAQPTSATLQWQDWGTPWTDLHMSELPCAASEADAVLLSFARHFYFGG